MNLKDAYLRAAVETTEQFEACLDAAASGRGPQLIYLDSGFFDASGESAVGNGQSAVGTEPANYVNRCHKAGIFCGLRLPYIWRDKAEQYFERCLDAVAGAGFDTYLFRNTESMYWFAEHGLISNESYETDGGGAAQSGSGTVSNTELKSYSLDHSIYLFNKDSLEQLPELLPDGGRGLDAAAFPLEMNGRELEQAAEYSRKAGIRRELTVYGRAPMMVSAQCINKSMTGCDRREKLLTLKDRTGAEMPVKNCCRFCYNLIYNAVPTVLFDMEKEIKRISPDAVRYEFTTETRRETAGILSGAVPSQFTRGHYKRGV